MDESAVRVIFNVAKYFGHKRKTYIGFFSGLWMCIDRNFALVSDKSRAHRMAGNISGNVAGTFSFGSGMA